MAKTPVLLANYPPNRHFGIRLALLPRSSNDALSDKGKPAVRLGRKAADQAGTPDGRAAEERGGLGPSSGETRNEIERRRPWAAGAKLLTAAPGSAQSRGRSSR